jgi:hypothetical protein
MTLKELPIGTQDFQILRKNNYLYVDKINHIHQMIKTEQIFFYQALIDLENPY